MTDDTATWFEGQFHRIYLLLLFATVTGAVLDGHDHAIGGLSGIVTVGHVTAYGAIGLITVSFAALIGIRVRRGQGVWESIPEGYHITVLAIPLFFLGGAADMVWHMVFGIEQGAIEVMSPTHLAILTFGIGVATGPLRRAWYRGVDDSWRSQFGMLSTAAFLYWILSYMVILLHPYLRAYLASWEPASSMFAVAQPLGVAGLVVITMLTVAFMLRLTMRFDPVPGGLCYVFCRGLLGMIAVSEDIHFVPAALLTGLAIDVLYHTLRPGIDRPLRFRLFAFLVPLAYTIPYFVTIVLTGSIVGSVHTWSGSIILSGLGGLAVTYLLYPSARRGYADTGQQQAR